MAEYPMRSLMFVPAHNQSLIESALDSEADVLLFDIEDSVRSDSEKKEARRNIRELSKQDRLNDHIVFPRVNDRESGHLLKDLQELSIPGVDGFMYPKSETSRDVYFVARLIETIEYERGFEVGRFSLIPLIETAAAVLNAESIAKESDRVKAIAYGCEDFVADIQGVHDDEHDSLFVPRALIAMAARAAGVTPIDTVHIDVHDLEDLKQNLATAKTLGFGGMLVLHPKELPVVHEYFTPSEQEVEHAKKVVRLATEAGEEGKGVAVIDGEFIGPPMVRKAKSLLEKYKTTEEYE